MRECITRFTVFVNWKTDLKKKIQLVESTGNKPITDEWRLVNNTNDVARVSHNRII